LRELRCERIVVAPVSISPKSATTFDIDQDSSPASSLRLAHSLLAPFAPSSCLYRLFGKPFSPSPDPGFGRSVAADSCAILGSSSELGMTAMAAIVGTIGESF
jgi:hypothetical protein